MVSSQWRKSSYSLRLWWVWPSPSKALPIGTQPGTLVLFNIPPVKGWSCCQRHWLLLQGPHKKSPCIWGSMGFLAQAPVIPKDTGSISPNTKIAQGKEGAKVRPSFPLPLPVIFKMKWQKLYAVFRRNLRDFPPFLLNYFWNNSSSSISRMLHCLKNVSNDWWISLISNSNLFEFIVVYL